MARVLAVAGLGVGGTNRSGVAEGLPSWPALERLHPTAPPGTSRCCLSYKAKPDALPKVICALFMATVSGSLMAVMGIAQIGGDAVASGADADAHAGGVGAPPTGPPFLTDRPLGLVDAAEGDGFQLPPVKAKDVVGFCDYLPSL
jgi:hypothetical protein